MSVVKTDFSSEVVGVEPPRSFVVDSSILESLEERVITREDIKHNRMEYEFPQSLAKVDIFEECRALNDVEDFELMYKLMMKMLADKDVIIRIKDYNGTKRELCRFHVTDEDMDLRGVDALDEYPVLINWLVEYIGAVLLKKYPEPLINQPQAEAQGRTSGQKRTMTPSTPEMPL